MNGDSANCVVVSVTDDFVPGALVTLHSFLKYNSWFDGQLIVIHGELSQDGKDALSDRFDGIRFHPVSDELTAWINSVLEVKPELRGQTSQFYSLEVFALEGSWSKVLYCDSDLLFRADIRDLWQRAEPFLCCPDGPAIHGFDRDRVTFTPIEPVADGLKHTFNSGLMLIDGPLISQAEFGRVLNAMSQDNWQHVDVGHTDQLVLNHAFAGRQTLMSGTYNFLLKHLGGMQETVGHGPNDAAVLHFNLSIKPWQPDRLISSSLNSPILYDAVHWWHEAWTECQKQSFLRRKVRSGKDQQ